MATIDELLYGTETASDEWLRLERYEIVPDYQDENVIYITNKKASSLEGQIVIAGDKNSQYLVFEIERYLDGIDITEKEIMVHYEREDGNGDNIKAVNVVANEDKIRFGIILPAYACELSGILKIMPFYMGDSYNGEIYVAKNLVIDVTIENGLAVSGGIVSPSTEWYEGFFRSMQSLTNEAYVCRSDSLVYANNASESAKLAKSYADSALEAKDSAITSMNQASASATVSTNKSNESAASATLAKSYAIGETGTRIGEDTDNAKYYCKKAQEASGNVIATTETIGIVKPDGTTITVDEDGTIHSLGGVVEETDPTVPSWAKEPTKPTYTAEEVGALPEDTQLFSGNYNDLTNKPEIPTIATTEKAGIVKPDGTTITVDTDGTIHGSSEVPLATDATAGIVKPDGETITVDLDGTLHSLDIKEVKGDSIHITDSKAGNMVVTDFEKNLIPYPYYNGSGSVVNGITWTVNSDGSIVANGTASNTSIFSLSFRDKKIKAGKYRFMSCTENGSRTTYYSWLGQWTGTTNINGNYDFGNGVNVVISDENEDYVCAIGCYVYAGQTVENLLFKPMLVEVAEDGTYPTEYIPPMGYEITACGQNLIPYPYADGESKTISGVTFTVNSDGSITANGTATANTNYSLTLGSSNFRLNSGKYILIPNANVAISSATTNMWIGIRRKSDLVYSKSIQVNKPTEFIITEEEASTCTINVNVNVIKGYIVNNVIYKPMLVEVESDGTYPTEYQPYKGTKVTVSKDTKLPLYGLQAQEGITNIFNSYGAKMKVLYPVTNAGQYTTNTFAELHNEIEELKTAIVALGGTL